MGSYILCNSPELVDQAVATLSRSRVIFLDCEGQNLGETDGILSLIGLGATHENRDGDIELSIFLVDVLAFASNSNMVVYLRPIFNILSSEAIQKVVFDGRMDASELLHGYGVQLRGVLDLQIADVVSRKERAETLDKQLHRLVGFLGKQELLQNRNLYMYVHRLSSLQSALKEHGGKNEDQHCVDHNKWLQRPFDPLYLQYSAGDIQQIRRLYDLFVVEGYLDDPSLEKQSAFYLALYSKSRPRPDDLYRRHSLLPLGIFLDKPLTKALRCQGCERFLPVGCFSTSSNRLARASCKCFVCKAIDRREQWKILWHSKR